MFPGINQVDKGPPGAQKTIKEGENKKMSKKLEDMSKTKSKLDYLMQLRARAMEDERFDDMVNLQAKIDALKIELGIRAGVETTQTKPPLPETETYVAGVGVKIQDGEVEPSPRVGIQRTPYDRDHRLTIGDLSALKQGQEPEERETE